MKNVSKLCVAFALVAACSGTAMAAGTPCFTDQANNVKVCATETKAGGPLFTAEKAQVTNLKTGKTTNQKAVIVLNKQGQATGYILKAN